MPNHIQNRLRIISAESEIKKILDFIKSESTTIHFAKIIPPPNDDAYNDIPSQASVRDSPNWWYTWNVENWGTKWNAYSTNDSRDTNDTVYFQTAWSAPIEVIEFLSTLFPSSKFEFAYADEDSGSNTGKGIVQDGIWIETFQPKSQSKEGYDLYFELNPDRKEDYIFIDGKYEYKDED